MVQDMMRDQPPPNPRFPRIKPEKLQIIYDKLGDILIVHLGPSGPASSLDVDGEYWLRMNPASREVYGIEIEGFEAGYLRRHPDIAELWMGAGGREGTELRPESRLALVKRILRSAPSMASSGSTAAG